MSPSFANLRPDIRRLLLPYVRRSVPTPIALREPGRRSPDLIATYKAEADLRRRLRAAVRLARFDFSASYPVESEALRPARRRNLARRKLADRRRNRLIELAAAYRDRDRLAIATGRA